MSHEFASSCLDTSWCHMMSPVSSANYPGPKYSSTLFKKNKKSTTFHDTRRCHTSTVHTKSYKQENGIIKIKNNIWNHIEYQWRCNWIQYIQLRWTHTISHAEMQWDSKEWKFKHAISFLFYHFLSSHLRVSYAWRMDIGEQNPCRWRNEGPHRLFLSLLWDFDGFCWILLELFW